MMKIQGCLFPEQPYIEKWVFVPMKKSVSLHLVIFNSKIINRNFYEKSRIIIK